MFVLDKYILSKKREHCYNSNEQDVRKEGRDKEMKNN